MSAVTDQPHPFGGLEREKHIRMVYQAFHRCWGGRANLQGSTTSLCPEMGALPGPAQPESHAVVLHHGEQGPSGVAGPRAGASGVEMDVLERRDCWQEPGTARGLTALRAVRQLHITTKPEARGPQCVPRRIYNIANDNKDQVFVVVEESSCVCLQCCGPARSCSLQGFDRLAQQAFHFERPLRADTCCLGCCLMEMRAYSAERQLIGTVHQRWSMFTPYFEVCDSDGSLAVRIQGPCCPLRCLSNQEFQVVSTLGETIGSIWKKWPGFNEECNMDHEYFGLVVPQEMALNTKVLLLAATFLLNYMFFEMS
ncbi:phospholipid scramblase family member 5 [Sardina pilchardus]|uniref:phospholipid scramblase family member 5 n=1 Tax=Sardina pilchardus TaxID=27697 RepID=UPI002E123EF0